MTDRAARKWKPVPIRYETEDGTVRAGLTDDMMRAFYEAFDANSHRGSFERLNSAYNAMIDAAPTPYAGLPDARPYADFMTHNAEVWRQLYQPDTPEEAAARKFFI